MTAPSQIRGGRIKGSSFVSVQVKGQDEIHDALRKLENPELTVALDFSQKKAANLYAKNLRRELKGVSKHMSKAVRVKRARTGKPDWVVGSRRKIAFFWHMVIGGTRDHGPRRADALVFIPNWNPYIGASSHGIDNGRVVRAKRVRGVRANPVVQRVAKSYERQAMAEADKEFDLLTGL